MPGAVVAAAVATGVTVGAAAAGLITITGSLSTFALATFGKSLAANLIIGALNKGKKPDLSRDAQDRKQSIRSSVSSRKFVYGRARVSGTLVYAGSTGNNNEYLHLVMPIHHGEFDALESTYLADTLSSDARFSGLVRVNAHLGASDQTVDSDLVAESVDWTTEHRLRGTGYIYLRLRFNQTSFASGIPNPSFVIRGRKVYDPRTGITAWSNNPALCALDYLIGTVPNGSGTEPVGIGADLATEIDLDTFIAAANICDEAVNLKAGGSHARYTCDGVVTMDSAPAIVMEQLLTSCAGTLVYTGGVYRLFVGASTPATHTITADMLRGPVRYQPYNSKRDSSNGVRGTYIDPLNAYEAADFPPQINSAYVTEDGGEERWMDLSLPYTLDGVRGQRLARQFLERGRRSGEIELPCNFSALGVSVWDCATVDIDELGLPAGSKWRVKGWTFASGGGIDLALQEENDNSYLWDVDDEVTPAAIARPTIVRSNEVPPPTDVTVSNASYISPEGSAIGGLLVEWTAAADAFVTTYEVEYTATGLAEWQSGANVGQVTSASIPFLTIGNSYDVRVRAKRGGGASSEWVQVDNTEVAGDTTVPSAPTGVSATAQSGAIKIDWVNPVDTDFRLARLYRHTADDSSAASAIADVYGFPSQAATYTDTVASGQTRYYWLKARDASGNLSVFSSGVSATAAA
jgi:hypothetical protein